MRDLSSQNQPQRANPESRSDESAPGVVKGTYQPVGKVDIAALRRQAKESGVSKDDRPEIVKGSYEPVGKVDIAAIRAKAQRPSENPMSSTPAGQTTSRQEPREESKHIAERSAPFSTSERLTSLPKPKIANKFGGSASFTGTKAPTPGGFEAKSVPTAAPVGAASRTFADQGGKTPAQIWAEKKARERGLGDFAEVAQPMNPGQSPLQAQTSGGGEWKSGYAGKSWAPVQITHTGKSAGSSIGPQGTGDMQSSAEEEAPRSPAGGVGSIRDRFSGAPPMGAPATNFERSAPEPDTTNKPNRGVPIPGLPTRPQAATSMPSPPPQPPRSPTPPTPEMRSTSPIRIAMPVARGTVPDIADAHDEQMSPPPAMPIRSMEKHAPEPEPEGDEPDAGPDPARAQAQASAAATFGQETMDNVPSASSAAGGGSGKRALVQYDYEAAGKSHQNIPCPKSLYNPTNISQRTMRSSSRKANTSPTSTWSTQTGGWVKTPKAKPDSSPPITSNWYKNTMQKKTRPTTHPPPHQLLARPPTPAPKRGPQQPPSTITKLQVSRNDKATHFTSETVKNYAC